MKRLLTLIGVIAVVLYGSHRMVIADEHPKEHPTEHKGTEAKNSEKSDAPQADKKSAKKTDQKQKKTKQDEKTEKPSSSWKPKQVEQDLMAYIESQQAKNNGNFVVQDDVKQINRELTLSKIHTGKIVKLIDGTSFVCADFKDTKTGEFVDVDFFMTPTETGSVSRVEKVQVHKINGNPRYSYVQEGTGWIQKSTSN